MNIMENKVDGSKLVLDAMLNNKENTRLLWMLDLVYTNNPNNKLTTLDDLLSWRTRCLQAVLTVKNDALQNSEWVDYVSNHGVTKKMIARPRFYHSWIVKDTEYKCREHGIIGLKIVKWKTLN